MGSRKIGFNMTDHPEIFNIYTAFVPLLQTLYGQEEKTHRSNVRFKSATFRQWVLFPQNFLTVTKR